MDELAHEMPHRGKGRGVVLTGKKVRRNVAEDRKTPVALPRRAQPCSLGRRFQSLYVRTGPGIDRASCCYDSAQDRCATAHWFERWASKSRYGL